MSAKSKTAYLCQTCGAAANKWSGKCEACGAWNSIVEEVIEATAPKGLSGKKGKGLAFVDLKGDGTVPVPRMVSRNAEFDRVTGGGLVAGSALLVGGDPGIGKSTLLLQIVCALANAGYKCAYVSGEEAIDQVRLRARRLGLVNAPVQLASATSVRDIAAAMNGPDAPDVIVVDSIQTLFIDTVDSAPGTVTQVRTCAQELIRLGKSRNIAVLIVGHVTKEGTIAGPKVLEHMVDTVLYFEGDRGHQFRILRTVKNRFGPTDEIGVFEMASDGLREVANPSALFLAQRQQGAPGSTVLAGLEGTRPVLVEVQALVATTSYGTPRRAVIGWDSNRLAMILAVLETRCGYQFSMQDVFLNIAGGLRITEPAADMAVAAALVSALTGKVIDGETVLFGEIGLAGEIRPVAQPELRLKEAAKLGFKHALVPTTPKKTLAEGINTTDTPHVTDLMDALGLSGSSISRRTGT